MDTPADPATPLNEVYQAFFADRDKEGTKQTTIDRYRYQHRAVREVARRQRPSGDPGLAGAVDPDRLPPVS